MVDLYEHQKEAVKKLKNGSILVGGTGSGKSRTALAYYSSMPKVKLYIITTARKRDTHEWYDECVPFNFTPVIDSWNNIHKYIGIQNAFFIFDEQRVIGTGTWVKSFLKIVKNNKWIILSATPGDVWLDYVPVFIANGFYKNRSQFLIRHVVYSRYSKYPKVDRYSDEKYLSWLRGRIVVDMPYIKKTSSHESIITVRHDEKTLTNVAVKRWNIIENKPIKNITELCYLMRRVVNSDSSRQTALTNLIKQHPRIIVFYNFNYELDLLLDLGKKLKIETAQWNGHKHEITPKTNNWLYLVQYTAGAEGWNCVETNAMVFYSLNYSYKVMHQAAGRIDRLNTKFTELYYYKFVSKSIIDIAIQKSLKNKKTFNENTFLASRRKHSL